MLAVSQPQISFVCLEYIARGQQEREQRKLARGWEGSRDGYLTEGEPLCERDLPLSHSPFLW